MALILFGVGEALLITANIGVSPWFVLHQGLAFETGYTIGITTFIVSIAVLLLWFPLKQKPSLIGTILNTIFISLVIDLSLFVLPYPKEFIFSINTSFYWYIYNWYRKWILSCCKFRPRTS